MYTDGGAARTARRAIGERFDAVFVGWAMLTGLLPLYIKSFTGVFFILLPVLFAYYRTERVVPALLRCWPIMMIGAWCVISALWSPYPGATVYYGLQMWLTLIVACLIGAGCAPRQIVQGLFGAMLIHGLMVFAVGWSGGELRSFSADAEPFVGLAGSKNTTADMASLGVMISLAKIADSIDRVRPLGLLLAVGLIVIDVLIIIASRSAGANAALSVASLFFTAWWLTRHWPIPARSVVMAGAAVTGVAAALTRSIWYPIVFENFLAFSGKDGSLTGRTYIWSRAEVLIQQNPWFGRGFSSFWVVGDLEPDAIWRAMYVENSRGFNFHNSIYEIQVYFGYFGLITISAIVLLYVLLLARRLVIAPRPITIMYASLIAYDGLRFSFESLPLGIFAHNTLLLYGALAHGVGLAIRERLADPDANSARRPRLARRARAVKVAA